MHVVVGLLIEYPLINVPIFATNGLQNGFSAIEHGIEMTFPSIL